MTNPTVAVVINHTPWIPARRAALHAMLSTEGFVPSPLYIHSTDYRDRPWQAAKVDWMLAQWEWAVRQPATHCMFMSDDLHLAPGFTRILQAMLLAHPEDAIGLLSNHPKGPALEEQGCSGYYTNSWLVGPAYILPRAMLGQFLTAFRALPDGPYTQKGCKAYNNDDSAVNEWITLGGGPGRAWHPLPTIIEHRHDLISTVGHGDRFSRERVSWREVRAVERGRDGEFRWRSHTRLGDLVAMRAPEFWRGEHPMLEVGGPEDA